MEEMKHNTKKMRVQALVWLLILVVGYTIYSRNHTVDYVSIGLDGEKIGISISGADTIFLMFEDIEEIEYLKSFDRGTQIDGIEKEDFCYGTFENDTYGTYTLCGFPEVPEYMVIHTRDGIYAVNRGTVNDTQAEFKKVWVAYSAAKKES